MDSEFTGGGGVLQVSISVDIVLWAVGSIISLAVVDRDVLSVVAILIFVVAGLKIDIDIGIDIVKDRL